MQVIKKKKGVRLKFQKSLFASLMFDKDGYVTVKVSKDKNDTELQRPGEYEHEKLNVILKEVLTSEEGRYTGYPNLATITYQGLSYVVFFKELPIDKKLEDTLPVINVMIAPLSKGKTLKKYTKVFQPEKGIFIDLGDSDVTLEKLSGEFPKVLNSEDDKIKIKESELNASDDLIQEFFLL